MYILHIKVVCHPEQREEAERFFKTSVLASRNEPGCLHYDWFVSLENPCEFYVLEKWATREDFERHIQGKFVTEFRSRYKVLLAQRNELTPLREI